jgi:hypothetical protein
MIGVTVFGLIFTPVFYVLSRWIALRAAGKPTTVEPAAGTRAKRR